MLKTMILIWLVLLVLALNVVAFMTRFVEKHTRVLLFKSVEQSKKRGEALQDLASETLFTWAYAITLFSVKPINASRPAPRSRSEEGSGTVSPERENAALNGP
jgi:hypothetical protein